MMEALERFEVAARTVWAHAMSETYGPHPHMEVDPFTDRDEWKLFKTPISERWGKQICLNE